MAPKLTAVVFQERYAELVAREYGTCTTAYRPKGALEARRPPIKVSQTLLKVWFGKYRLPDGAVAVSSADELQEKYGSILLDLAASHPSAFRLGPVVWVLQVSLWVSHDLNIHLLYFC